MRRCFPYFLNQSEHFIMYLIFCNLISAFIEYHLLPSYNNWRNMYATEIFMTPWDQTAVRKANIEMLPPQPPQPSQSSPEGSNSSQAMSFHCVETIQSFLPPLPATEKLCSLEKISPDHDCNRVVWFPPCHWSRLITWPSYWLLIGQFTWTLNRQQTPTVPVPETHILRPPSCVCCLLQQSTFSLSSANKGSRFRLNTRHILYF